MVPRELLGVAAVVAASSALVTYLGIHRNLRSQRAAATRAAELAAYAVRREWEYSAQDNLLRHWFTEPPFDRGSDRRATNVLRGRHEGREFFAYDHSFVTRSGGLRPRVVEHHHSVVALRLNLLTPGLTVRPTSVFGRLLDAVAGGDVRVGDAAFDAAFTVASPSPEFARDLLTPEVVDVLMRHRDLAWRLEGVWMLVTREGHHSPEEIETKLRFMDAVLDRIPEHVRFRLTGEQPR